MKQKHLLSLENFPANDLETIIETSFSFKEILERPIKKVPSLQGKTIVNLFFENSTRTRISFELAQKRLSADTVNFSASSSSLKKGESFKDTVQNIEAMKIDAVVMRHANRINGFTEIALTKLDVLGGLDEINICVGYKMNGQEVNEIPASAVALEDCEPIYVTMPGFPLFSVEEWLGIAKKCNAEGIGYKGLPAAAQNYISKLEALLGVTVTSVGVGPDRDATIDRV